MLLFRMPLGETQIEVSECTKYTQFIAQVCICKNSPLQRHDTKIINKESTIKEIHRSVQDILFNHITIYGSLLYNQKHKIEISHHYGINRFYQYGMCLLTLVNKEYCKKILILLNKQKNPEHYHKIKKETFFILYGKAMITVDGTENTLGAGDMITIEPNQRHSINNLGGDLVIEELSTKHRVNDSYYTDETISNNKNRKTLIYL